MFFDNQNAGRSSTAVAGGCASHTRASSTDRVGISCRRGSYDVLDIAAATSAAVGSASETISRASYGATAATARAAVGSHRPR
jgi:hypothetical protein